jgi:hypothetical protein
MYQTYQGVFRDGRFVSPESAVIPENVTVYVTVVGGEPVKTKEQRDAMNEFMAALSGIHDEPITDEDLADFANHRFRITREFGL